MNKLISTEKRLFIIGITKRLLAQAIGIYIHISLLAVTTLIVLLAVFGGSVNITINWDSWQKLLNSISNVW